MESGLFYGIYIPTKVNFEGSVELCPGSLAAVNYKPFAYSELSSTSDYDPEYPTDSPHWLIFLEKARALDVLKQFKEARLREFPNLEKTERYVQFGFESVQSLKLCGKVKKQSPNSATAAATSSTQTANNTSNSGLKASCEQLSRLNNGQQHTNSGNDCSSSCSPPNAAAHIIPSSINICTGGILNIPVTNGEKLQFRGPSKQELVEFRKAIENGEIGLVSQYVWENPRYLISCGDTPTNLKEGYRYNALHICAQFNRANIAEMLLRVVSSRRFADLYTGKRANPKMCAALNESLLDYYLNIPDKGRSETPLHFATKNGFVQVVAVLVSFPQCKILPNKDGQFPEDIICMRARNSDPELHKQIESLLKERFYVPVLRAADLTLPPQIGQPFSCRDPPDVLERNENSDPLNPSYKIKALAGPMNKDQAQKFCRRWKTPPRISSSSSMTTGAALSILQRDPFTSPTTTSSSMSRMLAGSPVPIKLPPQRRRIIFHPNLNTNGSETEPLNENDMVGKDVDSVAMDGVVDFALADKQNGNHKKHTKPEPAQQEEQMLSASVIGAQEDGLSNVTATPDFETNNNKNINNNDGGSNNSFSSKDHFEKYRTISFPSSKNLRREMFTKYREPEASPLVNDLQWSKSSPSICRTPITQSTHDVSLSAIDDSFKERHIKNSDFDKGVEVIGRLLAKQENVEWVEHWDFLNEFVDISQPAGLEKLEIYFLEQNLKKVPFMKSEETNFLDICNALTKYCMQASGDVADGDAGDDSFAKQHRELEDLLSTASVAAAAATNTSNIMAPASSLTQATITTIPQVNTPYTCVEKSLQVFAKRITKTVINNVTNVGSINDTLVSELKRLKSLICSFKEDTRFYSVDFGKVHSRIGNLVAIYIEHSQEVMLATKLKIQSTLRDLPFTHCDRREHLECVCAHMLLMLEQSSNELPDLLKTEELCSSAWNREKTCYCHWDGHLSRKTSRRKRTEAFYVQQAAAKLNAAELKEIDTGSALGLALQTENAFNARAAAGGFSKSGSGSSGKNNNNHYDNVVGNDVTDTATAADEVIEEEIFWSNCASEISDNDDHDLNDYFYTPPESNSPLPIPCEAYKTFVFGDQPTKRDLDVLNAIYHVAIDKEKYPSIFAWKEALLRYSNEEMDQFPTPMAMSKTHKLVIGKSTAAGRHQQVVQYGLASTPLKTYKTQEGVPIVGQQTFLAKIAGKGKRLFSTQKLQTSPTIHGGIGATESPGTKPEKETAKSTQSSYTTPLHRAPGLFSKYRNNNNGSDDSPPENVITTHRRYVKETATMSDSD